MKKKLKKNHEVVIESFFCGLFAWYVSVYVYVYVPPCEAERGSQELDQNKRRRRLTINPVAPTISALATFSPIDNGPKYSVGLPSGSSISDSNTGPLYFSLSAPSSYRWVGLGIGEQMAGASIFVMYADGNGNVTISARDGNEGHVQPLFDGSLMAGVELLAGSGISNGVMRANVRCMPLLLSL